MNIASDGHQDAVAAAGAIDSLAALLAAPDMPADRTEAAADALGAIVSGNQPLQERAASLGVVHHLVRLVLSGQTPSVRGRAAATLGDVVATGTIAYLEVAGAVPALVRLVSTSDSDFAKRKIPSIRSFT